MSAPLIAPSSVIGLNEAMVSLWNNWDPLGVFRCCDESIEDEYEEYARECCRLLSAGAEMSQLLAYLQVVVVGSMGMTSRAFSSLHPEEFAQRIAALSPQCRA